jgi:hypothetical protein
VQETVRVSIASNIVEGSARSSEVQPSSIWVELTTAFDTRQETVSLKPAQPGPIAFKVSY